MVSRLVDVSFEVGEGLCRDILCLVRWVGVRHAVGLSGVGKRPGMEMREGCPRTRGPVVSCWWTPSSDKHSPCGMGSARFLEMLCCRKVSRVPDCGERSYPGDDGTGARSNGGEDDADGEENVGLARKLLPVTWNPV
jgi:hypothetical protein